MPTEAPEDVRWLPDKDSNLDQGIQSPVCYRYTIRHRRDASSHPPDSTSNRAARCRARTIAAGTVGAEGGGRTRTRVAPQRFLRPPRLPFRHFGVEKATGAEDEGRTRDLLLGKEALYH